MSKWNLRLAVLIIISSFLIACQKEDQNKKPKKTSITQSSLYKINNAAAVMKLNIETSQKINCMFADRDKDRKVQKDAAFFIQDIYEERQNLCNFYTRVIKEVKPIFESIENSESIPKESFILTIIGYSYNKEDQRIYEEDVIGLFKSLDNCESIKSLAQKLNIPNKGCKKWNEKEF